MPVTPEQARAAAERIFEFLPGARPPTVDEVQLAGRELKDAPGVDNWDLEEAQLEAKKHVNAKPISAKQREDFVNGLIPYIRQAPEHGGVGVDYSGAHFDVIAILNSMGLEGDALVGQTPLDRRMRVVFSPEGKVIVGNETILDPSNTDDEWRKDPRNRSGYRANIGRDPKS